MSCRFFVAWLCHAVSWNEKVSKDMVVSIIDGKWDPLFKLTKLVNVGSMQSSFSSTVVWESPESQIPHVRHWFRILFDLWHKAGSYVDSVTCFLFEITRSDQLLVLLLDLPTDRIQEVLLNGFEVSRVSSSPHGFILCPLLFIMKTDSCRTSQDYFPFFIRSWLCPTCLCQTVCWKFPWP